MKIRVTAKHIREGVRLDTRYCPVALAIKEEGYSDVHVDDSSVSIEKIHYNIRRGTRFINRFDDALKVKPTTIELVLA